MFTIDSSNKNNFGPDDGGTALTITGAFFYTATPPVVSVGSGTATAVSNSKTTIVVRTPARVIGVDTFAESVCVRFASSSHSGVVCLDTGIAFTYYQTRIDSRAPIAGPTGGSTTLLLNGYFHNTGSLDVTIDGTTEPSCVHSSTSVVTCTTPSKSAGTYNVAVSTDASASQTSLTYSNTVSFTYYTNPVITSISPTIGLAGGSTSLVTITGTGFNDYSAGNDLILFNAQSATSVTSISSTTLEVCHIFSHNLTLCFREFHQFFTRWYYTGDVAKLQ
jgi:large repetitive protein